MNKFFRFVGGKFVGERFYCEGREVIDDLLPHGRRGSRECILRKHKGLWVIFLNLHERKTTPPPRREAAWGRIEEGAERAE